LYIINVDVILPPDLGPIAVNKYIHTYIHSMFYDIVYARRIKVLICGSFKDAAATAEFIYCRMSEMIMCERHGTR
jgi:hypothetical protein